MKLFADGLLMKLNLTTQAGTYVKEFVHGDFGRTCPSISTMFGGVAVDVLALDVTVSTRYRINFKGQFNSELNVLVEILQNVEVDWPPAVNYEKS